MPSPRPLTNNTKQPFACLPTMRGVVQDIADTRTCVNGILQRLTDTEERGPGTASSSSVQIANPIANPQQLEQSSLPSTPSLRGRGRGFMSFPPKRRFPTPSGQPAPKRPRLMGQQQSDWNVTPPAQFETTDVYCGPTQWHTDPDAFAQSLATRTKTPIGLIYSTRLLSDPPDFISVRFHTAAQVSTFVERVRNLAFPAGQAVTAYLAPMGPSTSMAPTRPTPDWY